MAPDYVKQIPGTKHATTRSKCKIMRQEMWQKSQLMLIQILDFPSIPVYSPTEIYSWEKDALDIDSLEQDINVDCETNSLHQEGVISENIPKAT